MFKYSECFAWNRKIRKRPWINVSARAMLLLLDSGELVKYFGFNEWHRAYQLPAVCIFADCVSIHLKSQRVWSRKWIIHKRNRNIRQTVAVIISRNNVIDILTVSFARIFSRHNCTCWLYAFVWTPPLLRCEEPSNIHTRRLIELLSGKHDVPAYIIWGRGVLYL